MALLEAMALSRPVVATAVGGVPEMVTHRVTGVLVEPRDERAMAEACLELAGDRGWAQALGLRARRRVEEAFSHEQSGRALVDVYRALVPGGADGNGTAPSRRLLRVVPPRPGAAGERQEAPLVRGARKLADRGARRLEMRRMERVRRDPSRLLDALRSARRILIVCQGNIIRSPFAARLLARELGEGAGVHIASAGLAAKPGTPSPPAALSAAAALRIDLGDHVASPLTEEAVATSDLIFVMDVSHLGAMQRRFPKARAKAFVFTCLAPEAPLEVRDPYNGDDSAFRACYAHICASTRPIARVLAEGRP
jgi:protein-tyrosine-phosphatase